MLRSPVFLAFVSILISVAAQFALKAGMRQVQAGPPSGDGTLLAALARVGAEPRIYAGFMLYGLGAIIWLAVLARWDVSKAYPLVGAGFIVSLAVGALHGELVSPIRIAGVVLISVGVALVARS